jgi:hypothetical protein
MFCSTIAGPSGAVVDAVKAQGLEGVIGKQREVFMSRSGAWVKFCVIRGEGWWSVATCLAETTSSGSSSYTARAKSCTM